MTLILDSIRPDPYYQPPRLDPLTPDMFVTPDGPPWTGSSAAQQPSPLFGRIASSIFSAGSNYLVNSLFGNKEGFWADLGRNVLGNLLDVLVAQIFAGGFQHGGRPRPREAIVVGERGAEVFVPDRPGRIVPHNRISRGGGGSGGDDRRPQGQSAESEQMEGARMQELMETAVLDVLAADIARRGPIARGIEQTFGLRRTGVSR